MYIETNKKSMKRIIIIGSLVSCALLALTGEVQAQNGIEQVLKNIEANNKELQANAQLITSQKLEAKTDNNLPDPTLSYAHPCVTKFRLSEPVCHPQQAESSESRCF